jgi:hypothetical protein
LLEKLAAMLADKWDASARGPSVATQGEGAAHGDSLDGEEDEDGEHGDDDDSYGDDDPTNDRKSFPRTIVRGLDANGVHSLRESSTEHASTLEDMLRAAGKGRGRKRTRVPS